MKLTKDEKIILAEHIAKKPIQYIELYNELYDHYVSANEDSDKSFQEVVLELDKHFHYQKVKSIDKSLLSKTKKTVKDIYWSEFKKFWHWPHIITTLGLLLAGIMLLNITPMEEIIMFVIIPVVLLIYIITFSGLFLERTKRYGRRKFKSAHFKANEYFLHRASNLFIIIILMPELFMESNKNIVQLYEMYPVVIFLLLTVLLSSFFIGLKVFKSKIKIQYL